MAMGGYISKYEVGGTTPKPKPKPKPEVINKRLIFGQGQNADTLNIPNNIKIGITPNDSALMIAKLGLTPNDVENLKEIQEDQLWNAVNRNSNDSRFPKSEFGNWFKSQLNGDNRYRFQNRDYRIEQYSEGGTNNPGFNALPEEVQENILAHMSMGGRLMDDHMYAEGGKLPQGVLQSRLEAHMSPEEADEYLSEYGKGGYTVRRSSDRKGKTHVVIGPDGTKKYFGDPNMGERGNSKHGKDAFYARHKKNLAGNPYFRAYARATWEDGGMMGEEYAEGGIHIKPENRGKFTAYAKSHGKGVQEMAAHIMANKEDYSPTIVKRANFAKNAAGWKHEMGGLVQYQMAGEVGNPYDPFNQPNEYASWADQNKPIVANTLAEVKPFTPRVTSDQINRTAGMNVVTPVNQVVPQLGSSANPYEIEDTSTEPDLGFFNKAGQFIQNNPGLVGQLGTAALTAGTQMNRVNRLARPRTLADVRLRDSVANPNLVDYSAERNAIDRAALTGMAEAQRGFGSSAAAQAFKNKARLNQLEGTGRSFQGQENANAQIKNQFLAARQEAAMKEAMMNNDISKYNLENVYGYDTMTTAQKNAITAMLGNTAGQAFGKQTDYKNQLAQANIMANMSDRTVLRDTIRGNKDLADAMLKAGKISQDMYNDALGIKMYGGTIKRSFRK